MESHTRDHSGPQKGGCLIWTGDGIDGILSKKLNVTGTYNPMYVENGN